MLLEPVREQIEIFVESLFRHCGPDGVVSLRAFEEANDKTFRITAVPLKGGLRFLMDAAEDDARRAAQHPRRVVFCPPICAFAAKDRAREQDIIEAPALSVELDENPQFARTALEAVLGPATLVVRSGGQWTNPRTGEIENRLHVHWRLTTPARGKEQIAVLKQARKLATAMVGGDPSNVPACHPIRWPGSWHRKAVPRLCAIETADPDREIDLNNALAALIADSPSERHKGNGTDGQHQQGSSGSNWADCFHRIISGQSYHSMLTPLAASFAARGTPARVTQEVLRALLVNSRPDDPAREQRRAAELSKLGGTVASAYAKFAPGPASDIPLFDPWQKYIVPAFPFQILPPIVEDFVGNQSVVIGGCPSALAMSALGVLSGALSHGFGLKMLRNGTWYESPRLWLLVGAASLRKTPMFKAVSRPVVHYEAHLRTTYETAMRDWNAAKKLAKESGADDPREPEQPPRYLCWDTTTEKLGEVLARCKEKGLLVLTDEISGWLGGMERYNNSGSRADRAFWLSAHDGGPRTVDRIKRGEIFIKNLSVSIVGGIQPARLAEIQGLTSDGLLQRFLPVMVGSAKFRIDRPSPEEDYGALVRAMIFAKPARLIMTDGALAIMTELHEHLFRLEQSCEGLSPGLQSFVGKLHGLSGSIALILHLAHDPQTGATVPVDEHTVENVRRLVLDFILLHAYEFYRAGPSEGERLRRLASWILTFGKERILASDLTTGVRDFRGLTLIEISERVSPLVAAGWLQPTDLTPLCRSWAVSPRVHAQFAERAKVEEGRKEALGELMGAPWASGGGCRA